MQSTAFYIHWPFCLSKCPYCDFNSHVRDRIDPIDWQTAYLQSIRYTAAAYGKRTVSSIFFGGGTPSLMPSSLVQSIIDSVASNHDLDPHAEITLEANPNSVEVKHFKDLQSAGVNRISIGIQALNDADLSFLGRKHTTEEAIKSIETGLQTFDRVSFDLIYGLSKNHSVTHWEEDLQKALDFGTSHLSLYQLTLEKGTSFFQKHERGDLELPMDEHLLAFYQTTQHITKEAGLHQYEVSNHAKKGQECQHNLSYWHYDDYFGVGPGAHGRITTKDRKVATRHYKLPEKWIQEVTRLNSGEEEVIDLSDKEQVQEQLLMGLRLSKGFKIENLPLHWKEHIHTEKLQHLLDAKFLVLTNKTFYPTAKGLKCLNAVLDYFQY